MLPVYALDVLLVGHIVLKWHLPKQGSQGDQISELVTIESGKNQITLNPLNISHISIVQHYATFYLNTVDGPDEVELKSSLVNILNQLPEHLFLQTHRSHVVNLAFVDKLHNLPGEAYVSMKSRDDRIPVSRRQLKDLKTELDKYLEKKRSIAVNTSTSNQIA